MLPYHRIFFFFLLIRYKIFFYYVSFSGNLFNDISINLHVGSIIVTINVYEMYFRGEKIVIVVM